MTHPDNHQWLSRLREFITGIPGARSVEVTAKKPGVSAKGRRKLQPLVDAYPELLAGVLRFYEQAAASCSVTCIVDVPPGTRFPGYENKTVPNRLGVGFQLLDAADIVARKEACETGASVLEGMHDEALEEAGLPPQWVALMAEHREQEASRYRRQSQILKTCIPIAALNGMTCLALVPASEGIPAGVYFVDTDDATRLCDTFDDWLQFQEKTYYPNPDWWSTLELWLTDDGVKAAPKMIAAVGGVCGAG